MRNTEMEQQRIQLEEKLMFGQESVPELENRTGSTSVGSVSSLRSVGSLSPSNRSSSVLSGVLPEAKEGEIWSSFLFRKARAGFGYRKRWFALSGSEIAHYKVHGDGSTQECGRLKLFDRTFSAKAERIDGFTFGLRLPKNPECCYMILRAGTEQECEEWISTIQSLMSEVKPEAELVTRSGVELKSDILPGACMTEVLNSNSFGSLGVAKITICDEIIGSHSAHSSNTGSPRDVSRDSLPLSWTSVSEEEECDTAAYILTEFADCSLNGDILDCEFMDIPM